MPEHNPPLEEFGPPKEDFSAPPPYELTNPLTRQDAQNPLPPLPALQLPQQQQQLQPPQSQQHHHELNDDQRPHLEEHAKLKCQLPTYEEVQMENGGCGGEPSLPPLPPPNPYLPAFNTVNVNGGIVRTANEPSLTFIAIDATDAENCIANSDSGLLGTDLMFITSFMIAFLFNWIGFLMLTCFCHTIASRYGALSGFGLSLAKWTLIVKHSTEVASHDNSWLWLLILAFGFLMCVRSLIQYVSIKRSWRLLSSAAQERLLFFY